MTPELQDRIFARLMESGDADRSWAFILLAALEGEATLNGYLDGDVAPASVTPPATSDTTARPEPPGVFLSSIEVAGFRGIGPRATLKLHPGPGLTLVVGRNGSGKSSFAEALEFLLTDRNFRWEKPRSKVWIEGWRNLHKGDDCSLKTELVVEGQGPLAVTRTWNGPAITDAETRVTAPGKPARTFESLQWKDALETFRPFLSYNELGSLLEDGPSKLYDALSNVLGLDELVEVQSALVSARRTREQQRDDAKAGAKAILEQLAALPPGDDGRFVEAAAVLRGTDWDLDAIGALVAGGGVAEDSGIGLLNRIGSLVPPDVDAVSTMVQRLRAAHAACTALAGSNAERARQRADLLAVALGFHESHDGADCPVCGTSNVLSPAWREATAAEIQTLRTEARESEAAASALSAAVRDAQRLATVPSPLLAQAAGLGLATLADATAAWTTWAKARDIASAGALAGHLEEHVLECSEALGALTTEAQTEIRRREDVWQPIATAIAEWIPLARKGKLANGVLKDIKAAESWWKTTSEAIRDERFEPIAARAMEIWKTLRLQSNVDLGGVDLEGTAQRRKVALRVTVDGTAAEALGVMSQGELHALALSLFLPRATLPESPFRFVSIDDPVQSMDPSRVDGLARVLAATAKTRQVLVFTHDDRLPEAVRRLGIPATIFSVTRADQSVVEVRETADAVLAYLDDARAVAKTRELPADVMTRVVPGFCRSAIEAACMETVRRRRLGRGDRHDDVEGLLTANARTHPLMALAMFDDEQRVAEVFSALNKRVGPWAVDVFRACKEGAHEAVDGDIEQLIDHSKRLAAFVRSQT